MLFRLDTQVTWKESSKYHQLRTCALRTRRIALEADLDKFSNLSFSIIREEFAIVGIILRFECEIGMLVLSGQCKIRDVSVGS